MNYSRNILDQWIARGENTQIDFKHAITSQSKIAKSLAAFANTRGGKIVVGVDDNGDIIGCDPDAETYQLEKAVEDFCSEGVNQHFEILNHQGARILISTVTESSMKPIYSIDKKGNRKLYIRLEDRCVISPDRMTELLKKGEFTNTLLTQSYRNEQILLTQYLQKEKTINLKAYSELKSISELDSERILFNFVLDGHLKFSNNHIDTFELT